MPGSQVASEKSKEELKDLAVVWATQHGLVVGAGLKEKPLAIMHAPITVLPVVFPADSFQKALDAMQLFNTLVDRVSRDAEYLQRVLAPAAEFDDFTARLLEIHRQTRQLRQQRQGQQVVLAINRSDYMLDEPSSTLLQVELNTIASSFGCLSTLVSRMHRFIMEHQQHTEQDLEALPPHDTTSELADAMALAARTAGPKGSQILFVVQPGDINSYDQQWLQTALWERSKIRTLRRTLHQIHEQGSVDEANGQLTVDSNPVSLVYYRAGYSPDDYAGDAEWEARQMLETSTAVQCPSVAYQLAGTKKVQQDLAAAGTLEHFLPKQADRDLVDACCAGLWSLEDLDNPETAKVLQQAQEQPDLFVLKPQREGGGNNLYGEEMLEKLRQRKGLAAYILMQRIRPPIRSSMMLRDGQLLEAESLSELGVYGTFIRQGDDVLLNKQAGHLVRTKAATSNEGGVAAGFAVLDSPYLVST
eukprot:jgi/Astpho2/176/fgenesh1_pg.00004_%23_70_t